MLPHWTDDYLTLNGVRIHYTRTGDGSKPPLVLAHGFSDSGLCWLPVARELEREYDVILPDAQGHGLSARVKPGVATHMVDDLAGLIRALNLNGVVLGGHSMGAGVSAEVAERNPGLLRALILEDPGWRDPQPEDQEERPNPFRDFLLGLAGRSVEDLMARCHADNPTWPEAELRPWAESKLQFDTGFFQAGFSLPKDWRGTARALGCPTLLITADVERGAIVSADMAHQAQALNPRIRVAHIPGAGHSVRREQFTGFMRVVREFLRGLPA